MTRAVIPVPPGFGGKATLLCGSILPSGTDPAVGLSDWFTADHPWRGSARASSGRPSSAVSIFCKPAIRWFVCRALSVRSLISSSLTPICCRKKSLSPSSRDTYSVATCRDWSGPVGVSSDGSSWLCSRATAVATCHGMSGLVATGRTSSIIGDVFIYRCQGYEIFFTEARFCATAVEVAFGAVSLNAAGRAGETSTGIALQGLADG
jgi:hypothetical protein